MANTHRLLRWEPAIYEHKAALTGKSPGEVSRSADLLARALEAEFNTYGADFMTVGIDVYNVEAESVGAEVAEVDAVSCPEIRQTPFALDTFEAPPLPDTHSTGRFSMMIDAARQAMGNIGEETILRIAASGPVSIASKLVGIEELVIGLAMDNVKATEVLDFSEALCVAWLDRIRDEGFDAIVFDSTAAPPILSPGMYNEKIRPRHERIMRRLEASGQSDRPLIIGGDTVATAPEMLRAGATTIICDYAADAGPFATAIGNEQTDNVYIRRNINPALFISTGNDPASEVDRYAEELSFFANPIAGTGILPYNADPDRYISFRTMVRQRYRQNQ